MTRSRLVAVSQTKPPSATMEQVGALRPGGIESLTRREREVLELIAAGWSNEGICGALFVSTKTVESHVHSIFVKLGLPRGANVHARVLATRAWLQANPMSRAA